MKVSLPFLAVAALCASLATAQFPRPLRQGRLFPFGWRSARPYSHRNTRPIRLYRFYPSHAPQFSVPANSFQPTPLTRFASQQQQVVTPFQPSSHFNREHASPQPSSGFSSYSSIDALPVEPFDQKNVPAGQDGSTQIPVLRDDENPPPKGDHEIVVDRKPQAAIIPVVDTYQQLNRVEPTQSEVAGNVDAIFSTVENSVTEPAKNVINMFYGAPSRPGATGNQVDPITADQDFSPKPTVVSPEPTVPRGPHESIALKSPVKYSAIDLITTRLKSVPETSSGSEQKFDQPKTESILEIDPNIYKVQGENGQPKPSLVNVRVIKTILPPSRAKYENSVSTQLSAEKELVMALTEEEFDELAKDIAESFVIVPSPEGQLSNKDNTKSVEPYQQQEDFIIEPDSSPNVFNSESGTEVNEASSYSPPPTKGIPIRATPSILIEQLKQNYPPKSIQETIASTEDTTESPPLSTDSLSELISGSSGAVPVISIPEISGLYLTPTADEPSIFRGGIGGLPVQDHRTGAASANVGVAVLPEAIPVDGKTRGMGYRFSYSVEDEHSGTSFSRFEHSDGELTQGQYRVLLPDGRTQIVKFFDDGQGYQADVNYV